ncbi:MAG: DUF1800 domain-containing protein [Geodermatophilaceae bacterium]|nr:DUF1800 domain-containing protein [Geodermatophilaceae bacterium]
MASILSADPVLHLLRRATYGVTADLVAEARSRGRAGWLDDQLHPERVSDSGMNQILGYYPLLSASEAELRALPDQKRRDATSQLIDATLARQLWSRRQLFELMVEFWNNHFNATPSHSTYATKALEDRTVMRANALGRFEDLLLADGKSAPMMFYLGNFRSELDNPNENYGRELLELHTVGLDSGFTQTDVWNSALTLTGRTIDDDGFFFYDKNLHYTGQVQVLGWSASNASASGGMAVGDDDLRYLARHPKTATHLSRKLAIRFVSDNPPASLVSMLADVYLDSGTAIVPWLLALFNSAEFAASVGLKRKRPIEHYAASMRALGIEALPDNGMSEIKAMLKRVGGLGMTPFGSLPPTGYPDTTAAWESVSGTLKRWNLHHALSTASAGPLFYPPLDQLLAGPTPATAGAMVDRLCVALTGQVFTAAHRGAVLGYAGMTASEPYDPEATEHYLTSLVVLILDSAYHTLR